MSTPKRPTFETKVKVIHAMVTGQGISTTEERVAEYCRKVDTTAANWDKAYENWGIVKFSKIDFKWPHTLPLLQVLIAFELDPAPWYAMPKAEVEASAVGVENLGDEAEVAIKTIAWRVALSVRKGIDYAPFLELLEKPEFGFASAA